MDAIPRLSVGLAVYNGENYLSESIEALLGQSYEDFELIISDNASTDGTADICRSYAKQDSRINYIRQPRTSAAPGTTTSWSGRPGVSCSRRRRTMTCTRVICSGSASRRSTKIRRSSWRTPGRPRSTGQGR